MTTTHSIRAGSRTLQVSRPEKVLFPHDGITKADLVAYYRTVARRMVPHLRARPQVGHHPDGVDGQGFLQKEIPDHFPDWIHRAELPKEGGTVTHVLCDDTATLLYLADQGCVTLHRWLSKADRPDNPDRLVIDLADLLVTRHPDRLTTAPRKQARGDRLYLDVQRNAYAQTAVAPYAVRARPGAPVAAPLSWDDLDDPDLHARRWTLADADDLLKANPWADAPRGRSLTAAVRRLAGL